MVEMNGKTLYLIFFNLASCCGWGYVNYLTWMSLLSGASAELLWRDVGRTLCVVQSLAVMEVVHSKLRIVRSPFFTTFLQVLSRIVIVWCYTVQSVTCQNHWSLYFICFAWSFAEIPRYLFYTLKFFNAVPKALLWCRYSFFTVLYPIGITGEILQQLTAFTVLVHISKFWFYFLLILTTLIYSYGSPTMYNHMLRQRKKVLGKGKKKKVAKLNGIQYPITDEKRNYRGTTQINRDTWLNSIKDVDEKAAEAIKKTKNWRFGYKRHVVENVKVSAQSPEKCLEIARKGLGFVRGQMLFFRDGKEFKLEEAMQDPVFEFETGFIEGKGKKSEISFSIPYKGLKVYDIDAEFIIDKWVKAGTIEPDAGEALKNVVLKQDLSYIKDKYFVLLGATSAMGPLEVLLSLGANIVAVDLNRPNIWKNIVKKVEASCAKLWFPLKKKQEDLEGRKDLFNNAGCDLLNQTPEIANWLVNLLPEEEFVVGGYAYLDGALFLKISIAMDSIIKELLEKREKPTAIAFLCSPTDVFMVPDACKRAQKFNHRNSRWWQKLFAKLAGGPLKKMAPKPINQKKYVVKTDDGKEHYIVSGIVSMQGPNYALSKRIQHWRCMVARDEGHVVSSNIAPSTATASVLHNETFLMVYAGLHLFKPMEVFAQNTSNSINTALLLNDVFDETSISNPSNEYETGSPLEIFRNTALHGGIWRVGWEFESLGFSSMMYFMWTRKKAKVLGILGGLAGLIGYSYFSPPHNWFM